MRLQIRLLATGRNAVGTKIVHGLAVAHRWLQHKSDDASTNVGKLIPLLISFPIAKVSYFVFKLTYTIQQRPLRLTCSEDFFSNLSTAMLRAAASLMSFNPFAISRAVLIAPKPGSLRHLAFPRAQIASLGA